MGFGGSVGAARTRASSAGSTGTHTNVIEPQASRFWGIGTAAHVDRPARARVSEVLDNRDGTLPVLTTIIDRNTELLLHHPFPRCEPPYPVEREFVAV